MGNGRSRNNDKPRLDWNIEEGGVHSLPPASIASIPPKSSLNISLPILSLEGMIQFRLRLFHFAILLISFLFYTKVRRVANIQAFLAEQSNSNSFINSNQQYGKQFKEAFEKIQNGPPAILLLNKFALNISLNFVCNLRKFPGAAERLVPVVFDTFSHDLLKKSFPEIGVIHWQFPTLEEKFGAGDGRYQLFQFFRAKLASLLTEIVPAFWMVQADTIWRQDLFNIINLDGGEFANADLVFDSEGDEGLLKSMIAGGYFFVRSSNRTKQFFDSIAQFLLDHFATDNNVMARQCILGLFDAKCAQIPYNIISNWRKRPNNGPAAALFQFDGGDGAADKFDKMRAQGHLFVEPKTIPPLNIMENIEAVKCLETSIGGNGGEIEGKNSSGKKNYLMTFVQSAIEFLMANLKSETFKHFILTHLFPYYAAYLFN